jgi:cytosine/adenosine deaminase-related metal-dependent hydrolase
MTQDLLITNVRPLGGRAVDILIREGRIAALERGLSAEAGETIDGGGDILLPGLVEGHTHLDKSVLGMGWYRNEIGSRLSDMIENERRAKRALGLDPRRQSARQIVLSLAKGSTHIRSHVDVDGEHGLAGIEGVMAARADYADLVDVEIVAFPQSGLMVSPGVAELMEAALKLGAEVVGGLDPAGFDRDPKGSLDTIFGLAETYGRAIDIHLHELGELGAFTLELIIERTRALAMQGKVTVSHAFCLGMADRDYVARLVEQLAEARVHIATTAPAACPAPPVKPLLEAGVAVAAGSDGIRDLWSPYGNADMLERAMFVGLRNDFRRDEDLELALDVCTFGGARVMGLADYGLDVGCHADLVLVPGETPADLVVSRPPRRLVLKRGRVVARDGEALVSAP